jgi:hypothetical protein
MSKFSRRSLVASAASLPALALPAVAVAASAEPDPIFAAIEKYQHAKEVCLAMDIYDDVEPTPTPEDEADPRAAVVDTRLRLAETVPTTLAGLRKYLDFVLAETARLSSDDYTEFFFCNDPEMQELLPFVQSLARSVRHIAGVAVQS